jgi:hypothetical protein
LAVLLENLPLQIGLRDHQKIFVHAASHVTDFAGHANPLIFLLIFPLHTFGMAETTAPSGKQESTETECEETIPFQEVKIGPAQLNLSDIVVSRLFRPHKRKAAQLGPDTIFTQFQERYTKKIKRREPVICGCCAECMRLTHHNMLNEFDEIELPLACRDYLSQPGRWDSEDENVDNNNVAHVNSAGYFYVRPAVHTKVQLQTCRDTKTCNTDQVLLLGFKSRTYIEAASTCASLTFRLAHLQSVIYAYSSPDGPVLYPALWDPVFNKDDWFLSDVRECETFADDPEWFLSVVESEPFTSSSLSSSSSSSLSSNTALTSPAASTSSSSSSSSSSSHYPNWWQKELFGFVIRTALRVSELCRREPFNMRDLTLCVLAPHRFDPVFLDWVIRMMLGGMPLESSRRINYDMVLALLRRALHHWPAEQHRVIESKIFTTAFYHSELRRMAISVIVTRRWQVAMLRRPDLLLGIQAARMDQIGSAWVKDLFGGACGQWLDYEDLYTPVCAESFLDVSHFQGCFLCHDRCYHGEAGITEDEWNDTYSGWCANAGKVRARAESLNITVGPSFVDDMNRDWHGEDDEKEEETDGEPAADNLELTEQIT